MTAARGPGPGLVSVIVPALGTLASSQRCLAAVLRHTRRPWELIAVTRGAGDTTASHLAGVPVAIVVEPGVRGLRAAWARGLREARGEFVALLGPDVVVTDAWIAQLVALAGAEPRIGIACPMTSDAPLPVRSTVRRTREGGSWINKGPSAFVIAPPGPAA
jgi:glycosyltransferase involved in cell wall biosynthesis